MATSFTAEQVDAHEAMLAERVFQSDTILPHFQLLLLDLRRLAAELEPSARVVSLERGLLYGGISLFAPFFHRQEFISVDCSPESADERGAYNAGMVDDPRCLRVPITRRASVDATGLESGIADLVSVPNLVHHVENQEALFAEMARITRPGGRVYVFEPLLRELHQMPDDYLRYTPFGMQRALERVGLVSESYELKGGPFSAIAYCWTQALQYLPDDQRPQAERWFHDEHLPQLLAWDDAYPENLVRKHTRFPVGFSVLARKPLASQRG